MSDTTGLLLTPGSPESKARGCTCPVLDNARGKGAYIDGNNEPQFWITDGCPLHNPQPATSQERGS